MAQSYVTEAGTLFIPGAVADFKVATENSGLGTTGVLMLIGEADAGPRFDLEESLQDNAFGPDQLAAVAKKYGSGPLVEAFAHATAAANDPNITGSFSRAILVKTNSSAKAESTLLKVGGGTYAKLQDKSYGKPGNLIFYTIEEKVAEVVPTTGVFTWTPPANAFDMKVILNGVDLGTIHVPSTTTAAAFKALLDAKGLVTTINGNDLTVSAPAALINGIGKSLEMVEMTTDVGTLSANVAPNTWVSKAGASKVLTSASEQRISLKANRQKDNIQEELLAGGEVALKIGYAGTAATVTITDSLLTTTVAGGLGGNLSLDLADFPTIQDVATFINSKPGYTCAVGNGILGQLPSTALDNVTGAGIVTIQGAQTGRIKIDAFRFAQTVTNDSVLVQLSAQVGIGLPALVSAVTYLAGGTKGGTTDNDVAAALLALEKVRGNFVVPLFSRDASLDVADGLTDLTSTYTIDFINATTRSHVLKCSSLKKRRNRQAFLSKKDTFSKAKDAASNTASFRCVMPFQDIRNPAVAGGIKQFAPWMGAVNAAAMQAAAFYKAIVAKYAAIVGAIQAAKDFDDQDDTQMEDALKAGLLPLRKSETGGWKWVSDQTTYGKDSNFVFNSIQATYVADIIAMTTAQRMENAFVGQSVADVNAALAKAFLETIMEDFLRLKLIAPSDDAKKGYKNPKIKINGTAMVVSFEVKLAGTIYFIPINFLISQVVQSA